MNRRRISLLPLVLLLAGSAFAAEERVAQLTKVSGPVQIERNKGGAVDEAKQMGPRVRNGSVFSGDIVATGTGADAAIVFTDGSEVKLKAGSRLSIREVDVSALVASGRKAKPIGRTIKLLAGDMWTNVVPNPQVATEFETPSGVAAVKGTTVELSAREKNSVKTVEGTVEFESTATGLAFTLGTGQGASLAAAADGGIDAELIGDSTEPIEIRLPTGKSLKATVGSRFAARREGFRVELALGHGDLRFADGKKLAIGDVLRYSNASFAFSGGTTAGFHTDEGSIEVTNESIGAKLDVGAGFGVSISEHDGQIGFKTDAGNPGPMPISVGGSQVKLPPNSAIETESGGGGSVLVTVEQGSAEVQNPDGSVNKLDQGESSSTSGSDEKLSTQDSQQQEQKKEEKKEEKTNPPQATCGECSVPDGSGGCRDVDAMCPDEPCVKGKKCQKGTCVGGRQLTSAEDPNCSS